MLRRIFVSVLATKVALCSYLPMTKTKKPKTLTELREAWTRGGLKRAANLTQKRINEIAEAGGKARKAQFEAQKNAKARELAATPTLQPSAP